MYNKDYMLRRNLDLWVDRKLFNIKYSYLSLKYRISRDRCRQIFLKVERRYTAFIKNEYFPETDLERTYFMHVEAKANNKPFDHNNLCKSCKYGEECETSTKAFSGCYTPRCYRYEEADNEN